MAISFDCRVKSCGYAILDLLHDSMVLVLQTLQAMAILMQRNMVRSFLLIALLFSSLYTYAQTDSTKENKIDSLLLKQKGLLGQLAQNLLADTSDDNETKNIVRNDQPFKRYENRIIRNIKIQSLPFGVSFGDTTKRLTNTLTQLANNFHYQTKAWVIRNNLFFREGDKLSPFVMGNNERFLRDLPFTQEARIFIRPVRGTRDSVDVVVLTKDVLSVGGGLKIKSSSAVLEVKEDNIAGWGDRLKVQTMYDGDRSPRLGFGLEYLKRNIGGHFIDGSAGYLNFNNTFNGGRAEEKIGFLRFIRPLVDPYMLWTYAFTAETHRTENKFNTDSVYQNELKYRYRTFDAWAGWNITSKNIGSEHEYQRKRFLLSMRFIDQSFADKPLQYANKYNYSFANVRAVLGAISLFKQNFYRTQYIYGFGRKEDLPEGIEATVTGGYTQKDGIDRPYMGVNFQLNFVTRREGFFNYTFGLATSLHQKKAEDVNLVTSIDYFTRLRSWNNRWKNRTFLNASFSQQFRNLLDEPLLLESRFGLSDFDNDLRGGNLRATIKAESVFFSPWSLLYFRFAPFVFGSVNFFRLNSDLPAKTTLYPAIGGGIRTRNESLIFGTMEVRGVYFPKKDLNNNSYSIQVSTNIRFKYNQNFIKRPEFVSVN